MIIKAVGIQRSGKTAAVVGLIVRRLKAGHDPRKVVSTVAIPSYGIPRTSIADALAFLRRMVDEELRGWLVFLDEADRYLSHVNFGREQFKTLSGLWQDEKLGNTFFLTAHQGLGIDAVLREQTLMVFKPTIDRKNNRVKLTFVDGRFLQVKTFWLCPFTALTKLYDHEATVK